MYHFIFCYFLLSSLLLSLFTSTASLLSLWYHYILFSPTDILDKLESLNIVKCSKIVREKAKSNGKEVKELLSSMRKQPVRGWKCIFQLRSETAHFNSSHLETSRGTIPLAVCWWQLCAFPTSVVGIMISHLFIWSYLFTPTSNSVLSTRTGRTRHWPWIVQVSWRHIHTS